MKPVPRWRRKKCDTTLTNKHTEGGSVLRLWNSRPWRRSSRDVGIASRTLYLYTHAETYSFICSFVSKWVVDKISYRVSQVPFSCGDGGWGGGFFGRCSLFVLFIDYPYTRWTYEFNHIILPLTDPQISPSVIVFSVEGWVLTVSDRV